MTASPLVRRWLRGVHAVARLLPVPPSALTLLGVACAASALAAPGWAVALVLASCACDALDGGVAVVRSRVTERGARLDALADRVCDVVFVLLLGTAWPYLLVAAAVVAFETTRPRPVSLTAVERPQRVAAVLLGLLTTGWVGAAVLAALVAVGAAQARADARS